jgi:tetratricopeptide (TPR) repeat protein
VAGLGPIIVGDLGSSDGTLDVCSSFDVEIVKLKWENDYSKARNKLIKPGFNFYIEPWEFIASGKESLLNLENNTSVFVIRNGIASKELRFWSDSIFINPVYETINLKKSDCRTDIVLLSSGEPDNRTERIDLCKKWLSSKPTSSDPYYYLSCSYLSNRMYKEFFAYANQYLTMENNKADVSSIMLYYYMAQIELHTGRTQEAAKHILICLSFCPSFSELWCLLGDLLYKQAKYEKAKHMYENAIIIGQRRLNGDEYPIEIAKYQDYPKAMIQNIIEIKEKAGIVVQKKI